MENGVPELSLAARSVERTLSRRRASYAEEVERLVEASFRLIRESGELEPRVESIVRAAGLSRQAFYRHFRSKDELLVAVLDAGIRRLGDYLRHRMQREERPEARIREWLEGMLAQALDAEAARATRPFALARGKLAERFPEEVEASERQLTAPLREAIAAAVETGALPTADPERDAETLYDLSMGWLQRRLAQGRPAEAASAQHLLRFALAGLGRRGGG